MVLAFATLFPFTNFLRMVQNETFLSISISLKVCLHFVPLCKWPKYRSYQLPAMHIQHFSCLPSPPGHSQTFLKPLLFSLNGCKVLFIFVELDFYLSNRVNWHTRVQFNTDLFRVAHEFIHTMIGLDAALIKWGLKVAGEAAV